MKKIVLVLVLAISFIAAKAQTAADFFKLSGLDNTSTYDDLVRRLGNPYKLNYSQADSGKIAFYSPKPAEDYDFGSLMVFFTKEGKLRSYSIRAHYKVSGTDQTIAHFKKMAINEGLLKLFYMDIKGATEEMKKLGLELKKNGESAGNKQYYAGGKPSVTFTTADSKINEKERRGKIDAISVNFEF